MPNDSSLITNKSIVIEVRDSEFAAALASIDVPFANPARPFTAVKVGGVKTLIWRFGPTTRDGKVSTQALLKAYPDPVKWIASNPEHPFAFALSTMLNLRRFKQCDETSRPLVGYALKGGRTIYVMEDSRKSKKLAASGARQV